MNKTNQRPVTAVIVGCGHRAMIYAAYAQEHPDELKIVGAADPSPAALVASAKKFDIPQDRLFDSAESLAAVPKFADAVINGTMDACHVDTAIPLLDRGYAMLLEKPFAVSETQSKKLLACVRRNNSKVMVAHILRYARFFQRIKELILADTIGQIITIATNEYVSFDHMVTSYVRGKWAKVQDCKSTMLLAKCSHDIDMQTWLMGEDCPVKVCSFGSRAQFSSEHAPAGAGTRCTLDCPLVDTCIYSAKRIYLDRPGAWDGYVWSEFGCKRPDSLPLMLHSLNTDNPYGRCVYRCDNDVVDRQSVLITYRSGAIGTHNMIGGSAGGCRSIHVTGTKGEIYGFFEQGELHVKRNDPTADKLFDEEIMDFKSEKAAKQVWDMRLMEDFVRYVRDEQTSVSCTEIRNSVAGHMTVFMADRSNEQGGMPQIIDLENTD